MKYPRPAATGKALLIVALAALLPMGAGLVATLYSVEHTLQRETDKVLERALGQLDQIFDQVALSARQLYPLYLANCKPDEPVHSPVSRPDLFVSEFKLIGDCTARLDYPSAAGNDGTWSLTLEPPPVGSDELASLHMRYGTQQQHMLAVLNPRYLTNWMGMIGGDTYLTLHIGGYQVWDDGALLRGDTIDSQRFSSRAKSPSWPYEITSTLSADDILRAFRDGLIEMLVKVGALSVVCAGLCHWVLIRARR